MVLCLTLERPPRHTVSAEDDVLLLCAADRLPSPFGAGWAGPDLDRAPHVRDDAHVAAAGHALLIVPQADERAGAMPIQSDRVRVHGAVDALGTHARARRAQDRIAAPAG